MLIFQYGSNCAENQLNGSGRLRGDALFLDIARVDDFELAFNVWSVNRSCAASDIVSRPGGVLWGALYDVPEHVISRQAARGMGRKSLDAIEGEGTNYRRRPMKVYRRGDLLVDAFTYTVISPRVGLKTNATYVGHIVAGLRERSAQAEYNEQVKAAALVNNPALRDELVGL